MGARDEGVAQAHLAGLARATAKQRDAGLQGERPGAVAALLQDKDRVLLLRRRVVPGGFKDRAMHYHEVDARLKEVLEYMEVGC